MIKKLFPTLYALYADENILYFNWNSGNVIFNYNETGILNVDYNNINLDNNFDKDDPDTIYLVTFMAWHLEFEKYKALKKEIKEELKAIAWHSNKWRN